MIGLGIDIIEIDRIEKALTQKRFLERLFTVSEQAYLSQKNVESIAGLFAAKEAISKVLGTGISGFSWLDIEVYHTESGAPKVRLLNGAKEQADTLGIREILISISHCKTYAVANAAGI